MSNIKVIDINEEAKQEAPIEEVKEEAPPEIIEEVKQEETVEEVKPEVVNEVVEEECKEIKKPEKIQDKLITCPKCNKSMKLKSYRYKHEKACRGTLEQKAVKPVSKPRAKPKAEPKAQPKIENTIEKQEVVKTSTPQTIQNEIHLTPYEIARQSYIQMKEAQRARKIEKINMFKSKMF